VCAVCGKTCVASCSDTRSKVPADVGSAVENDLRLVFLDSVIDDLGISVCGVLLKERILDHVNLLSAILEAFLSKVVDVVSYENCANLCILGNVLGKLAAFTDELECYVLDLAVSLFCVNPDVLVISKSVVALSHLNFLDSAELTSGKALITEVAAQVDSSNSSELVAIIFFEIKCLFRAALKAETASCAFFFNYFNSHY
jgi:hypothetical protein